MSATCYLCGDTFNETTVLRHYEHIIQNAVGGALVSEDILCLDCGCRLGKSVDANFATALSPLTTLLDPPRDRGTYSQTEAQIQTSDADARSLEHVRLLLKADFSLVPARPVLIRSNSQKKVMVIAATIKQAQQFAQSAPVKSLLADGYTLEIGDNAAPYAERLLLTVRPDAPEILRGVLKIAIGFASKYGIERNHIAHLITQGDLITDAVALRSVVFPYYPIDDTERLFETEKHVHEDWYPTHHLYLFSHGRDLYCYVELFGVVQKYVHLSHTYEGASVLEKFVQKAEKWRFEERWFTARTSSDLQLLAREFGVQIAERSWDQIQADVLQCARSRSYSLEPHDTIEKAKKLTFALADYARLKNPRQFEIVRKMFDKAEEAKTKLGLTLLDDLQANPLSVIRLLNKNFNEFRIGNVECSRPDAARRVPTADVDRYVAYKFYELLRAKKRESKLEYQLL